MSMLLRIFVGAVGLAILAGTLLFAFNLFAMEADAAVLLAGYMAIGGILVGAYAVFYATTGKWRPNLTHRDEDR